VRLARGWSQMFDLGDRVMPASMQDVDPVPRCVEMQRAIHLLNEALDIIDDVADRPDIGARLQHVLDSLRQDCTE
jgi:hypothetical protein